MSRPLMENFVNAFISTQIQVPTGYDPPAGNSLEIKL